MRYRHFIAAIIAFFATTSCYVDDVEQTIIPSDDRRDEITVVGRVARFDDREIETRGTKNEAEANVTCMAVAIFPIENGTIGNCVFYDFKVGSQLLFTINRQEQNSNGYIYNVDSPYVMYVFVNLPSMTEEACAGKTLAQMKAMAFEVEGVDVVANGFPMIGSLGDASAQGTSITPEGDGKVFILKPGSATNPTLPLVNGAESDLLNIPMKSLFSKVNFTIKVTPDQTVDVHLTPQFTLNSYTVHNVPGSVDFARGGGARLGDAVTDDVTNVIGPFENPLPLTSNSNIARGTQTVNFTFYLPERYLTPTNQSHDGSKDGQNGYYNYPFPVVSGKYRAEDLDLRQRFKPLLPEGQDATYVTINGRFRDHQQHEFDVTYDVYLGKDNFGNFDTERNCEYYHYVTIRGILNSDDQVAYDPSQGEMPVAIDHRVTVDRVEPIIINLRRETLLDSHFEVRPLRIRKNPAYQGDLSNAKAKVEVVYEKQPAQMWIGLERSFGNGQQGNNSAYLVATDLEDARMNSLGKRKYFTYDLTYNTLAGESQKDNNGYSTTGGQSVVVPLTDKDEAVWIYVDEAQVAEAGDAVRTATIRVTYAEDGVNYGAPIDYVIQQRQLFPVTYNNTEYLIEYEEEYLHNFDASDSYGQTEYEGMAWGLDGKQLSYQHAAAYVNRGSGFLGSLFNGIINYLINNDLYKYDFYLERDSPVEDAHVNKGEYKGVTFCTNNINMLNGMDGSNNDASDNIDVLNLSQDPKSAIEYCYNKNKRNAEGHVVWQNTNGTYDQSQYNWYLPAIDEIEEIVKSEYSGGEKTYIRFLDFQGKYYWSSQPSYERNYIDYSYIFYETDGEFYKDDLDRARATKVVYITQFDNVDSGVNTGKYTGVLNIRSTNPTDKPASSANSEGYWEYGEDESFYQDGNHLRTRKNRVRCVRKAN